jgi:hypothetical protein
MLAALTLTIVAAACVVSGSCEVGGTNRDYNDTQIKQLQLDHCHQQRITLADDTVLLVALFQTRATTRPDIRAAGATGSDRAELPGLLLQGSVVSEASPQDTEVNGPPIYATEAVRRYGVEWALGSLWATEGCESHHLASGSRSCDPTGYCWCEVGDSRHVGGSGELGSFQFMPSTWATTPFADQDPCDSVTAWNAAARFVSVGRQYEWTCWPR